MTSQPRQKSKILVVDDEPDNLELLYRTFYRDYEVLIAENAPAALDILARLGDIAVIVSDQRMPFMTGTEFLSMTAAQYPDIIRILLTGYTDVEDLVGAINAGKVFKYVTKPWDAEELRAVVGQAMDTHNVLKVRTEELSRTLRRESLLNTVTNTIRNAEYGKQGESPLRQILQTIVDTVGHMLEVDICILRPFQEERIVDEWFVYQEQEAKNKKTGLAPEGQIAHTNNFSLPNNFNSGLALSPDLIWETHDVQAINDVETNDLLHGDSPECQRRWAAYQQAGIRSSLIVPLICQQELVAVIALHQCQAKRQWQDDEIQLVVMVADQAALALSQASAYEQVKALAQQQALVNTITTAIRSSLDPQDIFAAITQQLGNALRVDGCALSLWTEDDEFVQCVGLYDSSQPMAVSGQELEERLRADGFAKQPNLPQSIVPIVGNPVLRQLLDTQKPVAVNDLQITPEMNGFDLPLRSPARAILVVPLLSDGKIIGSISLRQAHLPRYWRESEIVLAQAVAAQAAIAVQQSRLYQKTRQQAERLMELDRQKTEFFQNVSHEFRTPLTLMIGPLESVVAQKHDLPYEQAEIALRNSRRLLRLVNQLLDLQRLDAGRMQASFRPCNLAEFVRQIVDIFRPYCDKKGLQLETQVSPCPYVYLDLEKFDKVLYNLLSNAMKFTPIGGKITVKVEPAGDHIRLQVADTGIGIRKEQIPHLFERFRQAEGSANRSYEGSGLGLALVKELVELHGGQISVQSAYGEGTSFTVWLQTGNAHLPIEQVLEVATEIQSSRAAVELADLETDGIDLGTIVYEPPKQKPTTLAPADPATAPAKTPKSVLVVDDNSDLRAYVSRVLRQEGYQVWTARNGNEGLAMTREQRPDIIVTDLMMPVVSGLDMIRMIREEDEIKGVPIILLTAKADEETRMEGVERGADGYLSKPFNDRELLAQVRNLLALKENERRVQDLNTYLTESVLSRFLPPSMVQKAATGELSLDLGPEPRLITILFSDIVGFTPLANTLRSSRVAKLLNAYLEQMTRAVFENGGTVDKFMGDAILALFGAPEELSPNEQVRRAIATARQMYRSLDLLNQEWQEQGIVGVNGRGLVQFRCGIHQGTAVVGMFGSAKRSDYTAIGPAVNIASRLQEAAEPNSILVSATVADYLEDSEITKISPLKLKGIDETVLTFSVNSVKSKD